MSAVAPHAHSHHHHAHDHGPSGAHDHGAAGEHQHAHVHAASDAIFEGPRTVLGASALARLGPAALAIAVIWALIAAVSG